MAKDGSKPWLRYAVIAAGFWVVGVASAFWWQVAVRGGICSG